MSLYHITVTQTLICFQDYPSIGLVTKLLQQENVVPIYMVTRNEATEEIYNVGILTSSFSLRSVVVVCYMYVRNLTAWLIP